jgi:hypothetical protein
MLAAGGALLAINLDMVGFNASAIVLFGSCAVIGALAVSRQPGNLVGWLFLATGVVAAMQLFTGELALSLYRHGGPLLAVQWLAGRQTGYGISPLGLFSRSCLCCSPTAASRLAGGVRWPGSPWD